MPGGDLEPAEKVCYLLVASRVSFLYSGKKKRITDVRHVFTFRREPRVNCQTRSSRGHRFLRMSLERLFVPLRDIRALKSRVTTCGIHRNMRTSRLGSRGTATLNYELTSHIRTAYGRTAMSNCPILVGILGRCELIVVRDYYFIRTLFAAFEQRPREARTVLPQSDRRVSFPLLRTEYILHAPLDFCIP